MVDENRSSLFALFDSSTEDSREPLVAVGKAGMVKGGISLLLVVLITHRAVAAPDLAHGNMRRCAFLAARGAGPLLSLRPQHSKVQVPLCAEVTSCTAVVKLCIRRASCAVPQHRIRPPRVSAFEGGLREEAMPGAGARRQEAGQRTAPGGGEAGACGEMGRARRTRSAWIG